MRFQLKAASGPLTGQTFELTDDTRIGSAEDADIRHESLDERHARIVFQDGVLMLESSRPAEVNGERTSRRPLESGDELRFGTLRFVLQAPGLKPARVLDAEPAGRGAAWKWAAAAALAAAGAAAAWWQYSGGVIG